MPMVTTGGDKSPYFDSEARYEFFKKFTKINPTKKFLANTQAIAGLPGNQSPGVNKIAQDGQDFKEVKGNGEKEETTDAGETNQRGRSNPGTKSTGTTSR